MTPAEALQGVKDAFFHGRYFLDPHAKRRMAERDITIFDIKGAIMNATKAEPFEDKDRPAPAGVTAWRIHGVDLDGATLSIGVDLKRDHLGAFVVVVTVF